MSFLYHEACPKCGSSDAKAVYEGGSGFCFSCRKAFPPTTSPYLFNGGLNGPSSKTKETTTAASISLPLDASFKYGPEAVDWAKQYDVSMAALLHSNCRYSRARSQLIFCFYGADHLAVGGRNLQNNQETLLLYQARNFGEMAKQKYFTKGNPNDVVPIYYHDSPGRRTRLLTIVEDCLSAIKISAVSDAMPVLGSDLSPQKLKRLVALYGAFLVWLDGNMYHKAQKMAQRLQMLGATAQAVYTPLDPKCYEQEIFLDKIAQV